MVIVFLVFCFLVDTIIDKYWLKRKKISKNYINVSLKKKKIIVFIYKVLFIKIHNTAKITSTVFDRTFRYKNV